MTDLKKFTVKREQWLRGGGSFDSELRNAEGKMCCLGFCALQVFDYDPSDIEGVAYPHEIDDGLEEYILRNDWEKVFTLESEESDAVRYLDAIAGVNDSKLLSDDEREEKLTSLFHDAGIEIEFED